MLDCKQIHESLNEAEDGEMPLWKRLALKFHLMICPCCKRTERSFHKTMCALSGLRDCQPPMGDATDKPKTP